MITKILVDGEWVEGAPTEEGQRFIQVIPVGNSFAEEEKIYSIPVDLPNFEITNLSLVGDSPEFKLQGDIYWSPVNTNFTLTGNVSLPDGELMLIVEKVVNATIVINDIRVKATISNGAINATFSITEPGNYLITEKRLNEGLERIGAGFTISSQDIELDVY